MLFSEREGVKVFKIVQIDNVDKDLRTGLWNAFVIYYWNPLEISWVAPEESLEQLIRTIWTRYFKNDIDYLYRDLKKAKEGFREYIELCEWYQVYDFLEFIVANHKIDKRINGFINYCNEILFQEMSAYRFVGEKIVPITSQDEISEINTALENGRFPRTVQIHIQSSIELMSSRTNPDYRNSIKEAISAVEALCVTITNNNKATLGQALKKMEQNGLLSIHPALRVAFEKLYGYTSDAAGIRHCLTEEPKLNIEDARFMLVTCSAFLNYLYVKLGKNDSSIDN